MPHLNSSRLLNKANRYSFEKNIWLVAALNARAAALLSDVGIIKATAKNVKIKMETVRKSL